ncbi:MAG: helix-turn-helix domain-containing protein [bacterium]
MALGEILKNARVQRGLTPSDVAESTHLLVQIVEDLEREDFRRVAALIYGRGFIKLYAELLELDPEPLVREFMDLYTGSRVPAVRTKKVDAQTEPALESAPVTRTVTGPAPLSQRQTVQPRPVVRPLSMPQSVEREKEEPQLAFTCEQPAVTVPEPARASAVERASEKPEPSSPVQGLKSSGGMVVEPEAEEAAESDEPDLFRPQPHPRKSYADVSGDEAEQASDEPPAARKPRLPIFKIGGRMEAAPEPAVQDEASRVRRRARIQTFVAGVTKLKEGVERKLPCRLPHKQLVIVGGVGVVVLVMMAVGIHVLFKMTGTDVKETPSARVKPLAPPPDLYVD